MFNNLLNGKKKEAPASLFPPSPSPPPPPTAEPESAQVHNMQKIIIQLKEQIAEYQQIIIQLRSENETLELQINKMRNSTNLNVLALDEIKNKYEKEKMLRLLDKQGIDEVKNQLGLKDREIRRLTEAMEKDKAVCQEQRQVIENLGRQLEKNASDIYKKLRDNLENSAKVISCMREEIMTLKENKVFVLNSGAPQTLEQSVYLSHLQMGVQDQPQLWFGSQLLDSDKKRPPSDLPSKESSSLHHEHRNSSLFNPKNSSNPDSREPESEMESILKSKLDILEDEREDLLDQISQKESFIKKLNQKFSESKKLIEENLEVIRDKEREIGIQRSLGSPGQSKHIREKSKYVLSLLKNSYGSCIDLFLKMDQPSLIRLEKKLNNCIQVYHELNELIFSE